MLFRKSETEKKSGLFERMKQAITATKNNLVTRIETTLSLHSEIDETLFDELEAVLLGGDLGVKTTNQALAAIRSQWMNRTLKTPADVRGALRSQLLTILKSPSSSQRAATDSARPQVWMIVGVNGTGKTTTVGKLAAKLARDGNKVLICAADTFRAAAIEQLTVWSERSGVDIIKNRSGADPSAVLHDALTAVSSRQMDVLLVDTAGRLHTKD